MLSVVQRLLLQTHAEVISRFQATPPQGQASQIPPWDVRWVLSYLRYKVAFLILAADSPFLSLFYSTLIIFHTSACLPPMNYIWHLSNTRRMLTPLLQLDRGPAGSVH